MLLPGSDVKTFDVADFSLANDDFKHTRSSDTTIKIASLSQSTEGTAKLTFTRYFNLDPEKENRPFYEVLVLLYKGYVVGNVRITNY